ncbi:MAG: FKBP-type peptidyl-prolyl cis-trans isomerase [Bacteroidales bacterium]|nr:FKBP-type peptidyl-prolyl cis-trans isomerase [Bacteroidales bacterium]
MSKYLLVLAVIIVGIFALSSCSKEDIGKKNYDEGLKYIEENGKRDGVVTTQSGLQYEILKAGNPEGKKPTASSQVRCHYQGTFLNGKEFDSSYKRGEPLVFPLNGVIPGWTEGLQYMTEGAKFRFVIPYFLAYGPYGYGSIPPYSTLIFEVELIEVL